MRYWAYLAAKLTGAAGLLFGLSKVFQLILPSTQQYVTRWGTVELASFGHDLWYTVAALFFWLFAVGLIYLIVLDQQYRCRTCLRRLRMPLTRGTWNHFLLGAPKTEYICVYGHGTLYVPDVHIGGDGGSDWKPIDDMWKELEELEETRK